jgi:hypothetical protein
MNDAADYLAHIRSLILTNPCILHWQIVREEAQGTIGLLRYRLTLDNQDLLELFERFEIDHSQVKVAKYSFHWQRQDGQFIKRWDNAAHHPEIPTHPDHLHDGDETNVVSSVSKSVADILVMVSTLK